MSDRTVTLRQLSAELRDHGAVDDAFLAKSFTDRLMIIDINSDNAIPADVMDRLNKHDLHIADSVYGENGGNLFASNVDDGTRYHFVDIQTRGSHQSYVVD